MPFQPHDVSVSDIWVQVKCDERPNGCANCEKLHLECSGYQRQEQASRAHGGKRTYRSCARCRLARIKCSGQRPACAACRENNVLCTFGDNVDSTSATSSNVSGQDRRQAMSETSDETRRYNWHGSIPTSVDGHQPLLSWSAPFFFHCAIIADRSSG